MTIDQSWKKIWLVFFALLLPLFGCGSRRYSVAEEQVYAPSFSNLRAKIFVPRCGSCHGAVGSYKTIMQELVVSGDLVHSKLYTSIKSGSMPQYAPRLDDIETAAIATWISNGAHND